MVSSVKVVVVADNDVVVVDFKFVIAPFGWTKAHTNGAARTPNATLKDFIIVRPLFRLWQSSIRMQMTISFLFVDRLEQFMCDVIGEKSSHPFHRKMMDEHSYLS